jgi:hypothetical protein
VACHARWPLPPGSAAHRARAPQRATPMPDGHARKAPGPPALLPRGADMCHDAATHRPRSSRPAAGKPTAGWAHAPTHGWPAAHRRTSSPALWPVTSWEVCGPWPHSCRSQPKPSRPVEHWPLNAEGCPRASEETQPRLGVTLGSVQRLGKDTRAESEAGTRRRQGRWQPTHGELQDQPSSFPGSASSDRSSPLCFRIFTFKSTG